MKKALIFVSCILLVFTSCKKNSDVAPSNTISANINGVEESFNTNTVAQLSSLIKLNDGLSIYGTNGSATGADILTISLSLNQTLTKGSYTSGSNTVGLVSILYQSGPFSIANLNYYATDDSANQTTVIITTLTGTNIQGTFSGILVNGNATKTVTNGKFNLTLK